MDEIKRGDDAADHAPRPRDPAANKKTEADKDGKQDAPNYDDRVDDGTALDRDDVSSANDE